MIDSPSNNQIARIVQLGEWRDEGHCLAVGLYGQVSSRMANDGENHDATKERERTARRQRSSGRQGAAGRSGSSGQSGTAAASESSGEDRCSDLRASYLAAMPEIREYYPDLRVIEVEDGIWVVTEIFPIGRDGPFFSVCMFLHDDKGLDAKGFAFVGSGADALAVGKRHTNGPDGSICAFCSFNGVWEPGQSPHVVLDLYAEWLLCHLFLFVTGRWPGKQYGATPEYRHIEFEVREWCFCDFNRRYGDCHAKSDALAVTAQELGLTCKALDEREIPAAVTSFVRSGWQQAPAGSSLFKHPFVSKEIALNQMRASEQQVQRQTTQIASAARNLRSSLLAGTSIRR